MRFPTITIAFVVRCLMVAFVLQLGLVGVTQAHTLPPMEQRSSQCQSPMQAGWRPYRVQAVDTLESLVARTSVTLEQVMQINCLKTTAIEADALLLLPVLSPATATVSVVEQQPNQMAVTSAEVAAAVPALAALPQITIISTTETLVAALAAAPVVASSLASVERAAPASPVTTANMIAVALFVLIGLGIFFFALRPRSDDSPMVRNLFSTVGNGIFLFAGVLLGVILFPMVNAPSLLDLPTSVSAGIVVSLIALLVAKELFFSGQQWRTMNRLLNLGIAPLLMIFFLTVASRVAEIVN